LNPALFTASEELYGRLGDNCTKFPPLDSPLILS